MIVLKRIGIVLIVLITIQTITFYTISESFLVKEIGSNYESYVLQFEENKIKDIGVISELELTKEKVIESFKEFEPYNLTICKSIFDCSDLQETEFFYLYWFDFETKNPFTINSINEGEFAKEYGAGWDSKYIWIIYKWILIEKKNTGIS
jgi:hypothetical protein